MALIFNLKIKYSETCLKWNLGITETRLERKNFTVPVIQTSSTCINRNLPATERNFGPLRFRCSRFPCILLRINSTYFFLWLGLPQPPITVFSSKPYIFLRNITIHLFLSLPVRLSEPILFQVKILNFVSIYCLKNVCFR